MSGLFHRLARQAVGSGPTRVHTMARLPFVSPPEIQAPPEGVAAPKSLSIGLPESTSQPAGASDAVPSTAEARIAARRTASQETARRTTPISDPASVPESQSSELARYGSEHSIDPPPFSAGDEITPASVSDAEAPTPNPLLPLQSESRRDAAANGTSAKVSGKDEADFQIPAPIVDPPTAAGVVHAEQAAKRPQTTATGVREGGRRIPGSGTTADGEATEVHVHIGRIEVTATQEAEPARRKAPAGPKPMTLDEYLARRRSEA
jgi:hypothetical protein